MGLNTLLTEENNSTAVNTLNINKRHTETEKKELPDFTGTNIFHARKVLDSSGFKKVTYRYAESIQERNTVLKQNYIPGEEIPLTQEIILTLSAKNPVKHLPSIFQSMDAKNGDFLSRYMWIFHSLLNTVNITLDNIHRYFNPMESPADFFPWLVSWFSDFHNYSIPEPTLRLLIKNIVPLYRWRGTAVGITKLLEIIFGVRPSVLENYRPVSEYIIENNSVVEKNILDSDNWPAHFTVAFPKSSKEFTAGEIQLINDIIKKEKPAHTKYYLTFMEEKQIPKRHYAVIGEDVIW